MAQKGFHVLDADQIMDLPLKDDIVFTLKTVTTAFCILAEAQEVDPKDIQTLMLSCAQYVASGRVAVQEDNIVQFPGRPTT